MSVIHWELESVSPLTSIVIIALDIGGYTLHVDSLSRVQWATWCDGLPSIGQAVSHCYRETVFTCLWYSYVFVCTGAQTINLGTAPAQCAHYLITERACPFSVVYARHVTSDDRLPNVTFTSSPRYFQNNSFERTILY